MRTNKYLRSKCPRLRRRPLGCTVAVLALIVAPCVLCSYLTFFTEDSTFLAACLGAVFLLALWGLLVTLLDYRHFVHIHPYFEKPVSAGGAFLSGEAVAKNLESLDALADELSVTPLSEYGFADDFFGEQLTWYEPEAGLRTITTLLGVLEQQGERFDDAALVAKDLRKIADALRNAIRLNVRFCLLVRACNATNAMEWEQRIGTAF